MTPVRSSVQPRKPQVHAGNAGEGGDSVGPTALRALLLLTEAIAPNDPALARISDQELALLRVAMVRLHGGDAPCIA
ncbi:MAG: hypothetical protein EI684_21155 [Candidatus Viridilinea halotolerans]|uniref:Uncharacterized protein n=1 Tax=Candidatus Viridilinea halotolerans TaxID=2491704 RepID=A0A426TRL5_9CHLR|nr:MAG: hypothetical protein EI684_21155 [Candidatus Viridilinea halotolerans]